MHLAVHRHEETAASQTQRRHRQGHLRPGPGADDNTPGGSPYPAGPGPPAQHKIDHMRPGIAAVLDPETVHEVAVPCLD